MARTARTVTMLPMMLIRDSPRRWALRPRAAEVRRPVLEAPRAVLPLFGDPAVLPDSFDAMLFVSFQ
jgi:hypothetical protein